MPSCPTPACFDAWQKDAWRELRGTPFRDDPFTEEQWRHHLTWKRYIPEPGVLSIVLLSLAPVWLWSVFVAAAVGLYITQAEPAGAPPISGHAEAMLTPITLISFALSLLMLFKTNSSYSRWWEARVLWGSGYIYVRSILRLCISFVARDSPELLPPLHRWTAALLPALATLLRGQEHYVREHLDGLLAEEELEWLATRGSPPIAALQVLSGLLDAAPGVTDIERQQLETLLSAMDTVTGGCERILRQPIPNAYHRHTQRFLIAFITLLPFPFFVLLKWWALPASGVVAFLLIGIENVGVWIEEPSRVLPLNHMIKGTLRNLQLMMDDRLGARGMAAAAPGRQGGGKTASAAPPGVSVVVPRGAAMDGVALRGGSALGEH